MMVHPSCLNRQGSIKAAWQAANSPGHLPLDPVEVQKRGSFGKGINPLPKGSKALPPLGYHHLWLAIPSHCLCLC